MLFKSTNLSSSTCSSHIQHFMETIKDILSFSMSPWKCLLVWKELHSISNDTFYMRNLEDLTTVG